MRSALFLVVLAGCFHDDYTVDDYWNELAVTHCNAMHDCCTPGEYNDWWSTDDGTMYECRAAHDAPSNAGDIRESIRAGKIEFSAVRAHACIAALEALVCPEFQPAIRYRETYCDPALHGIMPIGATGCTLDEECESRHCASGECAEGIPRYGACTTSALCDAPYRCQTSGQCDLGFIAGAVCDNDSQCEADWCKGSGIFTDGTCTRACDGR